MNREIKFRVFDKKQKAMFDTYPFAISLDGSFLMGVKMNGKDDWLDLELESVEVMQYTGLRDKNNKEIWEGDILTFDNKDLKHIVTWDADCACFSNGNCLPNNPVIIGNIYQNPELLEAK